MPTTLVLNQTDLTNVFQNKRCPIYVCEYLYLTSLIRGTHLEVLFAELWRDYDNSGAAYAAAAWATAGEDRGGCAVGEIYFY